MTIKKILSSLLSLIAALTLILSTEIISVFSADTYVKGDINADGSFDEADIRLMQDWLTAVPDTYIPHWEAGDLCADEYLNVYDLCAMKRLLVSPPSAPYEGQLITSSLTGFGNLSPSTGNVRMLSIYVDFADAKYSDNNYNTEQIQNEIFGYGTTSPPLESITAWFERSSYGNLHIDGDVYHYTCRGNMYDYSQKEYNYEPMAMEVLKGLEDQIDFSDYDSNGDGYIDLISFTVPLDNASDEMKSFWYGGNMIWYYNPYFSVDGIKVSKFIILDVMPNANDMEYLKQTLLHEMGHSFGLPDYYKYDSWDKEGLKGDAGFERMDDAIGDYCSFSKIMLGWLKDTQIQRYEGNGTHIFTLSDASNTGDCLIIPINSASDDYNSEYFLIEYVTQTGSNADVYPYTWDSGVRIFHIRADLGNRCFKYANRSPDYMGDDKMRIIRLVNDNNGFYHTGDTVSYGASNFAGYDFFGYQTVDTGYTVSIGDLTDGKYTITVTK